MDIIIEVFLENNFIVKKDINICGQILRKFKSPFKEISLSTIFGAALLGGITIAMIFGFGIRECNEGTFK